MKAYFWDVLPKSGIAPELGKGKFVVAIVGKVQVEGLAQSLPNAEITVDAGHVRIVAHDNDYNKVINYVESLGAQWQEGKV